MLWEARAILTEVQVDAEGALVDITGASAAEGRLDMVVAEEVATVVAEEVTFH